MSAPIPIPPAWKLAFIRHPVIDGIHFLYWRLFFGCRLENRPELRADHPVIFAGNHGSHFDFFFLHQCLRRKLARAGNAVAWDQMARIPFVRLLIFAFEAIPVSRHEEDLALRRMVRGLRSGGDLWVLCEGHRRDTLGNFHPGAAAASLLTGCPVVPMSLRGVQPLFKDMTWPNRLWGKVSMRFHAQIHPQPYLAQFPDLRIAAEKMTADIRAAVASGIDYPDGLRR